MFWIIAAAAMGLCLFALLQALVRPSPEPADREAAIAFYQSQQREIERQAAEGLLGPAEAKGAATEAARGLLAATAAAPAPAADAPSRLRAAALLLLVLVPAVSLPAYALFGTPGMPDFALAGRALPDPANARIDELVKELESRIAARPAEIRGRELLVPLYVRSGRFGEALEMLNDLIRIDGRSAARDADRGEILAAEAGGIVTADAKAAFESALTQDPKSPKARFYLARAAVEDGDKAKAGRLYSDLLADLPAGSPVHTLVETELKALAEAPEAGTGP